MARALGAAMQRASVLLAKLARGEGGYSPDSRAIPFPQRNAAAEQEKGGLEPGAFNGPLSALVEDWWDEAEAAGRKQSTYESYQKTMMKLVGFLKHDEAGGVTPEIVRFKDHRLRGGASAKTVKDSDLAGLNLPSMPGIFPDYSAPIAELEPLIDKVWRYCESVGTRGRTVTLK